MRKREDIQKESDSTYEQFHSHSDPAVLTMLALVLETQLDIRELLQKQEVDSLLRL